MSNRSCENCKFDSLNPQGQRMIQCGQGHARTFEKIIEDCHAWEEKSRCWWCESWFAFKEGYVGTVTLRSGQKTYEVVKKLIRLNSEDPKCPLCDKRLTKEAI